MRNRLTQRLAVGLFLSIAFASCGHADQTRTVQPPPQTFGAIGGGIWADGISSVDDFVTKTDLIIIGRPNGAERRAPFPAAQGTEAYVTSFEVVQIIAGPDVGGQVDVLREVFPASDLSTQQAFLDTGYLLGLVVVPGAPSTYATIAGSASVVRFSDATPDAEYVATAGDAVAALGACTSGCRLGSVVEGIRTRLVAAGRTDVRASAED